MADDVRDAELTLGETDAKDLRVAELESQVKRLRGACEYAAGQLLLAIGEVKE